MAISGQTVKKAVAAFKRGGLVVVVDDKHRENEGDLVVAASKVTARAISFMARYGRGLICVPMLPERLQALNLSPMVANNTGRLKTAFTVSCDAREGTTTGISAFDRVKTVQALIDPKTRPADLLRPGHLFPLSANPGGVLKRAGHTEATIDLARLAGLYPAGVLCEIMGDDGRMLRARGVQAFVCKYDLPVVSIAEIIEYRQAYPDVDATVSVSKSDPSIAPSVIRIAEARLPTRYGDFRAIAYEDASGYGQHLALVRGNVRGAAPALVRLHSRCLTGDVLGSLRCDCGEQVVAALKKIGSAQRGVFLYLNQEGRGIGLGNKIKAYALQERGMDTVEANEALGFAPDLRDYRVAASMLHDLGVKNVRLLTNNPRKVKGIEGYGLNIIERVPLAIRANKHSRKYLGTKKHKLGHLLNLDI